MRSTTGDPVVGTHRKLLQTAYRRYCVSEKRVIRLNGRLSYV